MMMIMLKMFRAKGQNLFLELGRRYDDSVAVTRAVYVIETTKTQVSNIYWTCFACASRPIAIVICRRKKITMISMKRNTIGLHVYV